MFAANHQLVQDVSPAHQREENADEYAQTAPADKAIIAHLVQTVARWCFLPLQALPDHIDDATQYAVLIHALHAARFRETWPQRAHLARR